MLLSNFVVRFTVLYVRYSIIGHRTFKHHYLIFNYRCGSVFESECIDRFNISIFNKANHIHTMVWYLQDRIFDRFHQGLTIFEKGSIFDIERFGRRKIRLMEYLITLTFNLGDSRMQSKLCTVDISSIIRQFNWLNLHFWLMLVFKFSELYYWPSEYMLTYFH